MLLEELITAIYARQSVERADSISIERQIELCSYETHGRGYTTYIDRGYSGKNTNRPQFSRMMNDIMNGSVKTVVVYKLDRISRSVLDFAKMMEIFGRYQVKFISATEKFDTSSPMGNAMLNICVIFAQLERETIQRRVADAYYSRCRRSFYMGGRIPYGFRKVPVIIDGIHTSMYEPVPDEAEVIRLIFGMYAEPFVSLGDVINRLNELGIKKRGVNWSRSGIRETLLNPIYVRADKCIYDFFVGNGADVVNQPSDFIGENGCYSYKSRSASGGSCTEEKEQIVIAPHAGITEAELWLECRRKCSARKQMIPSLKAKNSWLCGKVKCGKCGYALIVRKSGACQKRYLMCSNRLNSKTCDGAGTIYADELEDFVLDEMRSKAVQCGILEYQDLMMWEELGFDDRRQVTDKLVRAVYATDKNITLKWRI